MDRTLWLGGQAFSFWVFLWPISLGLVAAVLVSFVRLRRQGERVTARHAWLLLPAIAIPLLLVVGGIWEGHSDFTPLLLVLVVLQVGLSVGLVVAFKEVRLFALAVCLFWLWAALCCAIVAQMALTDVWL